jgi:lipoprotein-anchoring transpeptidase ErfK/SrfK
MILVSLFLAALLATTDSADAAPATGGAITMAASTKKNILEVRVGGKTVKRYHVSVGTKKFPTPNGQFKINHIVWNPAWVPPPDAKWAKGKEATAPGDKKNPMKVVKIFFQEPDYYIHGTGDEAELGSAASHGCIRMAQTDAFALGRYLMDNCGAKKDDAWYAAVFTKGEPADVHLPKYVPFVVGP